MRTRYISEIVYNNYISVMINHKYKIGDIIQYYGDEPLKIVDIRFYDALNCNPLVRDVIYVYNTTDANDFDFIRDVDGWDVQLDISPVLISE